MYHHIELLQNKIKKNLINTKRITTDKSIFISEYDASDIIQKLVSSNPIYKIFCTGDSALENLEFILSVHIGLLEDEEFIGDVAAIICSRKEN